MCCGSECLSVRRLGHPMSGCLVRVMSGGRFESAERRRPGWDGVVGEGLRRQRGVAHTQEFTPWRCGAAESRAVLQVQAHLVLDGLAVLGVADHRQLQLGHLLHLPVHVDLLQQATHLAPQQAHRVLLALALGQQRGAGRVDGRHPVLQVGLVAGLWSREGDEAGRHKKQKKKRYYLITRQTRARRDST